MHRSSLLVDFREGSMEGGQVRRAIEDILAIEAEGQRIVGRAQARARELQSEAAAQSGQLHTELLDAAHAEAEALLAEARQAAEADRRRILGEAQAAAERIERQATPGLGEAVQLVLRDIRGLRERSAGKDQT